MTDQRRQNEQSQVTPEIERRNFIQAGLASAAVVLGTSVLLSQVASAAGPPQATNSGADQIPRRPLGKTREQVSIIGVGGYHLGTVQSSDLAIRLVQEAVDAGVTFFDNAWEYNDHRSEEWMGLGLQGRRDKVFLMSKVCTHGRDKKVAMQQLEESLTRLGTDHLDLWQIHEVIYENDPDLHFAKGGVVEALDEAKSRAKFALLVSLDIRVRRYISKCWRTITHSTLSKCRSIVSMQPFGASSSRCSLNFSGGGLRRSA
jgi:uncharacterized protein